MKRWTLPVVAVVCVWTTPDGAADDDCAPKCVCEATYRETEVQPAFDAACIEKFEVVIESSTPGCCKSTSGEPPLPCPGSPKWCEWQEVSVTATPQDGGCKIRLVRGADWPIPGSPLTITVPTKFEPEYTKAACGDTDLFTFQAVGEDGEWVDFWRLQLDCGQCEENQDSDG